MRLLTDKPIPESKTWSNSTHVLNVTYLTGNTPSLHEPKNTLKRWIVNLRLITRILSIDRNYDALLLTVPTGILYALINKFLLRPSPAKVVLLAFWLHEPTTWQQKFKDIFRKAAMRNVDLVITQSSRESERYANEYGIDRKKIIFIPFHTNEKTLKFPITFGDYVFSGGRSGRDFNTLIKAIEGTDIQLKLVVSANENIDGNLPKNIEVLREIPHHQYLKLLKNARIVVVPLNDENRSSGQIAMLEAMGAAKPVIVTKTVGTEDYITPGMNGFYSDAYDVNGLRQCIKRLHQDIELVERLGKNARQTVKERHLLEHYVTKNLQAVSQLFRKNT